MIERRPFGRTGPSTTVTLFGGAALGRATQDEADRALDVLLRPGVSKFFMADNQRDRKSVEEVLGICRARNVAVQIFGLPT